MFFGEKFVTQWTVGDFSGTYWAAVETDKEFLQYNPPIFQIIYIIILVLLPLLPVQISKDLTRTTSSQPVLNQPSRPAILIFAAARTAS